MKYSVNQYLKIAALLDEKSKQATDPAGSKRFMGLAYASRLLARKVVEELGSPDVPKV